MSHFVVFAILRPGQTLDQLMAPFDENLEVEPYVPFTFDEKAKERQEEIAKCRAELEKYHADTEEFKNSERGVKWLQYANQRLADLMGMSDEDYYNACCEDYPERNDKGEPLTKYNPKSKWDWYQVGGRWQGIFLNKQGEECDELPLSEVDWEALKEKNVKEVGESWDEFERLKAEPLKEGETPEHHEQMARMMCGLSKGVSREDSIEKARRNPVTPFALVTPDGEWYERGRMGWFACVSDEKPFEEFSDEIWRLIQAQPQENVIVNVDCHI